MTGDRRANALLTPAVFGLVDPSETSFILEHQAHFSTAFTAVVDFLIQFADFFFKEALIKAGKGEVSSQKRRKCQGKERIEGRNPWNSYTSQLKGRKSPMRVGVNRPLWQAYTDLRWRRARVIG